jgi:hypothetical protein
MSFYFSFTTAEQECRTCPVWGEGWTSGMREDVERGCRGVNIVQICVHLHVNGKLIPVETTPGMMGEEDKGE